MLGEEPEPPYERPPLSNDYLSGAKDFPRLLIRSPEVWSELEAAAVLRKLDKAVTVLEAQDRVLARVAGVALSRFFEA